MLVSRLALLGVFFAASSSVFAGEQSDRATFKTLSAKIKAGKSAEISTLREYKLFPYLEYQLISKRPSLYSTQTLEQFVRENSDSPLSKQMSETLMSRYNEEQQWGQTFTLYQDGDSLKAECLQLRARIELGDKKNALADGKKVWMSGRDRPKQCDPLFKHLVDNKQISYEDYWQRIKLAMNRGATSLAKSLSKKLNASDRALANIWIGARSNPRDSLKKSAMKRDSAHTRDIVEYAIKRIARKDTDEARVYLQAALRKYNFDSAQQAEINRYIGVSDAKDHKPHALTTLASVPAQFRDQDANEWLARIALRQGSWTTLLDAVNAMSTEEQDDSSWKYWKARALEATNRQAEARPLYQSLTENASFYGFLAADKLGQPYRMLAKPTPQIENYIPALLKQPGIQRAFELLALDMKKEARAEWFFALKDRNPTQLMAAAKLAQDRGHHFTAILTLSRAKAWNEVGLRFPMPYESMIRKAAVEQNVSPALIYGVARRESAFDPNIVSHAKAQGLMQLIPGTAKQVSRGLGIKRLSKKQTFDPQTNIRLGAAYLETLLKRFNGNYALATASYNAGPHRMPRWRPDYPLEAARWVESIPYNETRNYVQAVLGYMTIYEYKLKRSESMVTRLSKRLEPITP
ncbi:transglycosylase SLT domain-containing protein [Leucothrix arctica]|uniref:Lytic murein transglycosylase n=1 Tax=Leucothrix arctica TaxID=1481894 RepID=A0A317C8J3_9GAMM|nr:transglycosylase SLT domain-containing protein [Leucothrix arctica]PWQ94617.1 hypothetical protein DKT75_15085 [Leucothrix arctica]